jgi:hypothetical protein
MKQQKTDPGDRRSQFQRLVQRREKAEHDRGLHQRQSLEGLRLAALMKQMQALQAIQGFQELTPQQRDSGDRSQIPTNREERARQRQWLEYKADWLQAMLEDALTQLEALDRFEAGLPEEQRTVVEALGNEPAEPVSGGELP